MVHHSSVYKGVTVTYWLMGMDTTYHISELSVDIVYPRGVSS